MALGLAVCLAGAAHAEPSQQDGASCSAALERDVDELIRLRNGGEQAEDTRLSPTERARFGLAMIMNDFVVEAANRDSTAKLPATLRGIPQGELRKLRDSGVVNGTVCAIVGFMRSYYAEQSDPGDATPRSDVASAPRAETPRASAPRVAAVSPKPAAAPPRAAAPTPAASAAREADAEPTPAAEARSEPEVTPAVNTPKTGIERDRPGPRSTAGNTARAERPAEARMPMPVARPQTAASPAPAPPVAKPREIAPPAAVRAPEPAETETAEAEPSREPSRDPTPAPAEFPMEMGKMASIDAQSLEPSRPAEPARPTEPPRSSESARSSGSESSRPSDAALPVDPGLAKAVRETMKEIDIALSAPLYLTRQDLRTDGKTRTDREMRGLRKRTMDARMELLMVLRKLAAEPERHGALKTALGTEGCTRIERRIGALFEGGPGSEDGPTALQLWKGPDNE